jgi:cytochrome bd-type quinol oxidase subunit 2
MKKYKITFGLIIATVLILSSITFLNPIVSYAQPSSSATAEITNPNSSVTGAVNPSPVSTLSNPLKGVNSVGDLIRNFVEIFSYLVILLAVLMIIYVGFQYIMAASQGDTKKISEQHTRLLWLVVGIAVVIGARVLVDVVINTISATGTVDPTVIQSARDANK